MKIFKNRWFIAGMAIVLLGGSTALLMARDVGPEDTALVARVKKGEFKVVVTTAGELRAKKFVQITGPANAQQANQYQMKIASIVPEGTVVKTGDIVAELDRQSIAARLAEVSLALQKAQAVYEQASLDSTLNLSKAREDIHTMELGLEERRLAKEQAAYEAPTVKRQAEIDYEKADRALAQAKMDYVTKTSQAEAKMREVGADKDRQSNAMKVVQDVMQGFTVRAPAPGMVIYMKDWNGKKRGVGGQVNPWDGAVVATLPDLTVMESQTYVNEIDIRKLAVGQPVNVTLDSDPSKKFAGKVTEVANVGEQRPNSDAKVFEVKVELTSSDTTLRPGMTTANAIETFKIPGALFVPIEAISTDSGVTVVYKRSGGGRVTKQEVETGTMSDDEVVILRGLEEDDRVLLAPPANHAQLETVRLTGPSLKPKTVAGDSAVGAPMQKTPAATPGASPSPAPSAPPASASKKP
ncbi:MAG TPA: HlyD family efflux transporter periplasmic adaptor subunit, partial [Gemmatimonadaceae bacterium]